MPRSFASSPSKEKVQVIFGMAIRLYREERQLTQEVLAELPDHYTNYVSSVEGGERNISLFNIARLAYALRVLVSELMGCLDPA
jgi:transcriptional regulator with XRE-family HTH domain